MNERITLFALAAAAVFVAPATGHAQSTEQSAREALESQGPGGEIQVSDLLVAEALPGGQQWATEVSVEFGDDVVRYPIKFDSTDNGWTNTWTPVTGYWTALREVVGAGGLPSLGADPLDGTDDWVDQQRLPAFPVVVTGEKMTTPMGRLRLGPEAKPLKKLRGHVGSWITEVLADDQGPAAVDILASRYATWRNVTAVLYAAAGAGLFRINMIVGRKGAGGGLAVLPATAPVFESGRNPDKSTSLVVGMYPTDDNRWAFRISAAGTRLGDDEACVDGAAFCIDTPEAFGDRLRAAFNDAFSETRPNVSHVMFAATGDVLVGDAAPYLARLPAALGVERRQLFLGYIGEASELLPEGRNR